MSLARGANYSQAGIHTTLNDPFDVRDTVRITDATAGARRPIYEGTDSDEHLKQRNWQPGFTILQAGLFLLAVVLVLGSVYLVRRNQVTALAIEVNRMNDSIYSLMAENAELDITIMHQRENDRIDYEAVQVLGMIPRDETEIVSVHAPNPRPYERKTALSAAGF